MEKRINQMFSLRQGESPLEAVSRIRAHPQFPYLTQSDIMNLVKFLNKMSFKYSKTDIKYELYLLFISYHLLPSPYATCRIGEIYFYGRRKKKASPIRNIRRNYNKALQYLTLASTMNYPKADYLLGMLYYDKHNYENMLHYLELAASVCHPDALYQLGMLYFHGNITIKKNFNITYKPIFKRTFMLSRFGDSIKSQYIAQRLEEMKASGMNPVIQGECPICLDHKIGYSLPCNDKHFVCCECLVRLLNDKILANGQIKCPMCRALS